jgi:lipopolysaccharide biosynthesis glycosyltransferase
MISAPRSATSKTAAFFSFAHNFWPHTVVAASSLLAFARNLDIHIFADKIDERWLAKLKARADSSGGRIDVHEFDPSLVKGLKDCGHYGLSTYYRLFVPELLADQADRLIYLDSDMIVRSPIQELLNFDLGGSVLAAVPGFRARDNQAHAQRLGHGVDCPYFNAGIMIIDPQRWKRADLTRRCLAFQQTHPERIRYADQDMLNYCLAGDWKSLPFEWNVMVDSFWPVVESDLDGATLEQITKACSNPRIVHFNGQFKPWHFTYRHPYKQAYLSTRRSLQKTPYISDDFPWFLTQKLAKRFSAMITKQ